MSRTAFWYKFIFPIEKAEYKPFFLLASLMFFVIFNNTLVRNLKDCFLVMNNGALSIAFIKLWGVLPATFLALLAFAKISNMVKQENVFYIFVTTFLVFFAIFGFIIFPNQDLMPLHHAADWLRNHLPIGFEQSIGLIEYWYYSLFYIFSELWSSVVVGLLFWQFANAVVLKGNAKRFYPLFGLVADIGMIIAGIALVYLTSAQKGETATFTCWQTKMQFLSWLIIIFGLCSLGIYYMANRYFENKDDKGGIELQTQQKTHLSIVESAKFLGALPNMRYLAMMVLGFAITSNLIEIVWKCQIEGICDNMIEFTNMMGLFSILTGIMTIFLVFVGGNLLRALGWIFGALLAPLFIFFVGVAFFVLLFLQTQFSFTSILGLSLPLVITFIGSLENILGKSIKFSLFDPTKEMAFIPMDLESKLKGKAAIDVFGVRLGKSAGSLFHQGVAVVFGSFESALWLYLMTFSLVVGLWILAVKKLYQKHIRGHGF